MACGVNPQRPSVCICIRMLWTIAVILIVLWALGMATAYTASGLIHVLLLIAIVVVVIRVIQGRQVL